MEPMFESSVFALFLFFTICVTIFFLRKKLWWCRCDTCSAYLSSSWASEFHNLCDWYTHLLRTSPTQTVHVHVLGNIITSNPNNVEHILKTRFDNYPKGKPFSAILSDLLGKGIFNSDGDSWLFQRKLATLHLGSVSVRTFAFSTVTSEIETRLIPLLIQRGGDPLDLQDVFRRFSFDNICKFSFGLDPGCLESSLPISDFADSFDLATRLSAVRATASSPAVWKIRRFFNVGRERRLRKALRVVNVLAAEVIRQKRKLGFSNGQDLLSRFMAACSTDDSYLRDVVVSFILAGRDTMASALTNFFYLLSTHPGVVARIRSESSARAAGSGTYEKIRGMQYLHAAVYESLRLYPPVQFDSKFAREDDVLPDGTHIRKGDRVTYHPYAMGRMRNIWGPNFLEYKPERWLEEGVFHPVNAYKYPVFQAGVRVCLGKEMAIMEMKVVALSVLERFDLKLIAPGGAIRFEPGLTAMVRGGLRVRVENIGA